MPRTKVQKESSWDFGERLEVFVVVVGFVNVHTICNTPTDGATTIHAII